MEYGHIVLSKSFGTFISKSITFFTDSYFSHSFITIPPISGKLLCIEAVAEGVNAMTFESGYENDPNEDYIMYEVNLPQETKDKAIGECLKYFQRGYGFLEYPWYVWRWLCGKFGKDIKHQDNWSDAGIVCSELAADYLKSCGLSYLFEGYGKASIVPEDLYKIIKANPQLFTEVERKIRDPQSPYLSTQK